MGINWKNIGTQGRIDAIRSVWVPKCSAAQIAAHFEGATRNSIIGTYHRHIAHLFDTPLTARSAINEAGRKKKQRIAAPRRAVAFIRPEPGVSKPLPAPRAVAHEAKLCGKPLLMLNAHECRWPVNDADREQLHLFCGMPAESTYCAHHKIRSHRSPDKTGVSA